MHSSHLQKCLGILLAAALLVSCFSASAFALSVEIELPSAEVSPGDIVEGSIYIVNAGSDNNLMSYQFSLVSNAPVGEDLELTVKETDYLKLAGSGVGNVARDGIVASSGDGYTAIDSEKQRIAGFTMKVPENPQLSSYSVSIYTDEGCSFVDTASAHYNEKQTGAYRTMNTETMTMLELDCEDLAVTPGQITVAGVTPSVSAVPQVNPTPAMSAKTEQEIISLGSDPHPTKAPTQAPAASSSSSSSSSGQAGTAAGQNAAAQQTAKTQSSSGSSSSGSSSSHSSGSSSSSAQASQSVSQNSGSQQSAANPVVSQSQDSKQTTGSSQSPKQTTPVKSPGFGIAAGLGLLGGVVLCLNRRNMH
ncbi:MAG TPA: hypothetical protein O0X39_07100 [Methanocorpusculum sp.]|nr:hypothetical protein [Methanocorpusculum sp.]